MKRLVLIPAALAFVVVPASAQAKVRHPHKTPIYTVAQCSKLHKHNKKARIVCERHINKKRHSSPSQVVHHGSSLSQSAYGPPASAPLSAPLSQIPVVAPAQCHPAPSFRVGIQDDNVFVWNQEIGREQGFTEASRLLNADLLRFNVVYGAWVAYGPQHYLEAASAAVAHGYEVQVNLVGTPSYWPQLDQTLSYQNMDPSTMESWSKEVVGVLGTLVNRYAVWNEPNWEAFGGSVTPEQYANLFMGAYNGIKAANPGATVIADELAPWNEEEWLTAARSLPAQADSVHPYDQANQTAHFVAWAGRELDETEYGNAASDPNQAAENAQGLEEAKCGGASELIFYQLVRNLTPGVLDLGIINP
jgi:hypothetical protein